MSEVRVTSSSLNCSSCWAASATSAAVPRPTLSSACSLLRISSARLTARSAAQSWTWALARFQYCCSTERTCSCDFGLEPPGVGVGIQPSDHDRGGVGIARLRGSSDFQRSRLEAADRRCPEHQRQSRGRLRNCRDRCELLVAMSSARSPRPPVRRLSSASRSSSNSSAAG